MLKFKDRVDAGQKLAAKLLKYKEQKEAIAIGLPRGGVVVAFEVAKALKIPLSVIVVAKLSAPENPELAIGAIAGKEIFLDQELLSNLGVDEKYLQVEIAKKKKEVERRFQLFCKEKPSSFSQKNVIVIDDGMATGSTMEAAVRAIQKEHPLRVILAVPVAPQETVSHFKDIVDEIIVLTAPINIYAVGQFYESFEQTPDEEVIRLLNLLNS